MSKLIIPDTTTATRTANTPGAAEILYDSDLGRPFYGDGSTVGGNDFGAGGGSVEWQASPVTTSPLAAVAGNGYFIDSGTSAIEVDFPGSPTVGDEVGISTIDNTNGVTFDPQTLKILGATGINSTIISFDRRQIFTYSGTDRGWVLTLSIVDGTELDINGLTADASPVGSTDYVITYDASATGNKKVLLDNLPGGGGGGLSAAQVNALIVAAAVGG